MSAVYVFEELRLPLELLAASLCLLLPFGSRRRPFWPRVFLGLLVGTGLALLFFPIFQDKETPRLGYLSVFWYGLLALYPVAFARACFVIGFCDALYFAVPIADFLAIFTTLIFVLWELRRIGKLERGEIQARF